jgi:hypothetical protein
MIAKHYLRRLRRKVVRSKPQRRKPGFLELASITCAEYLKTYRPELKGFFPNLFGERGSEAWVAIKPTLPEGLGFTIDIESTPYRIMPESVARLMLPIEDAGQGAYIEEITAGLQRNMIERAERTFYSAFGFRPDLVNCRCTISTDGD